MNDAKRPQKRCDMSGNRKEPTDGATAPALGPFGPAFEYFTDAAQRTVLFWDVMRQRGNQYREHIAKVAPHVLDYPVEVVIDGRTLDRPVNYALVRVIPPKGVDIDPTRRPFVVVDPRAGLRELVLHHAEIRQGGIAPADPG
jgi:Protein of unknown function (DUF3141)